MRGYYFEPGLHVLPRRHRNDVIAVRRYEKYNTQQRMPAGYSPLPQFNRSSWVTGLTYKPNAGRSDQIRLCIQPQREHGGARDRWASILGIGWWF